MKISDQQFLEPDSLEKQTSQGRLEWIACEDVPKPEMPVSAKQMILHYLREGRYTDHLYTGITEAEGTRFTVMREF